MGESHGQQGQSQGARFGESGFVARLVEESWSASHSGLNPAPALLARQSLGRAHGSDDHALPLEERFWMRPGAGYRLVTALAAAHVGAGILAAVAGGLAWSLAATRAIPLAPALASAAIAALAGGMAFGLARIGNPRTALVARALPPVGDLLAACVLLWLVGSQPLALLFFVAAPCMAAFMFSWRSGAALAAVGVVCFAGINALRPAVPLAAWVPGTLALASLLTLVIFCVGVYSATLASVHATLREETETLRQQRETQTVEQQRLLETLNLLEDAQARLERERVQVNQQIVEVATAIQRLAQGDLSAARTLQPGMFGPLEAARTALGRLTSRLVAEAGSRAAVPAQQRSFELLIVALREQTQSLLGMETAVHELGASANRLVAEIQVVERGSGELPGIDRHQLFQVMRGMEQRALMLVSHMTMLGARLVQLRAHQSELEAGMRRLAQATERRADWEQSGLYHGAASTHASAASFGSSGVLSLESLPPQANGPSGGMRGGGSE